MPEFNIGNTKLSLVLPINSSKLLRHNRQKMMINRNILTGVLALLLCACGQTMPQLCSQIEGEWKEERVTEFNLDTKVERLSQSKPIYHIVLNSGQVIDKTSGTLMKDRYNCNEQSEQALLSLGNREYYVFLMDDQLVLEEVSKLTDAEREHRIEGIPVLTTRHYFTKVVPK